MTPDNERGGFEIRNQADILDFLLAITLLSRMTQDKKIKLIFYLCDDDDDGCMTPVDLLNMLQRVQRIFARETSRVPMSSQIL